MPDPSRTDVAVPDEAWAAAVLLHPHPAYGGDRRNVVVEALWRALPAAGVAAVRCDFGSDDLADGVAEAAEALDLLPAELPSALVGYSFGGLVAARVVEDRLAGWVLVAPPFGPQMPADEAPAGREARPKLLLVPAHDQFCQPSAAAEQVETWQATTVEAIPSADHFLGGSTERVAERVVSWLGALAGR